MSDLAHRIAENSACVTRRVRCELMRIFLHTDLRACTQVSDLAHKVHILHTRLQRKRSIVCDLASALSLVAHLPAHRSQILHTNVRSCTHVIDLAHKCVISPTRGAEKETHRV